MVYMRSVRQGQAREVGPDGSGWSGGIHTGTCYWLLECLAVLSIKLVLVGYLWGPLDALLSMGRVEKTE